MGIRRFGKTVALVLVAGAVLAGCSLFRSSRAIEPCELLTDTELAGLGDYGEPKTKHRRSTEVCTWYSLATEPLKTTVKPQLNIEVRHKTRFPKRVDDEPGVRAGQTTTTGRRFVEKTLENTCGLTLYLDRKSTVAVSVTMPDPKDNCTMAHRVAEIIDPKLS